MRFAIAIWALVCATACLADSLTLRNGRVVEGTYLGGTARTVNMQVDDATKTFDVTDIAGLQFTAPALDAPKPNVEGLAGSPVQVVIYEDLQCPDCAAFRRMMDEKLLPKYAAKVTFIHHDFPLAKHVWARRAAIAARFFTERDAALGLEYRRYAMASQEVTSDATFNQRLVMFAQAHGIDANAPVAALSNPHFAELVDRDYQDGVSRGVVHTPTVFVNGKPFIETFTYEEISKAIDESLAQAH